MMTLRWSPDSLDDLDIIYDIIAEDDEDNAYTIVEEIREHATMLLTTPRAGVKIEELDNELFRELHFKKYTIVYEIQENVETKNMTLVSFLLTSFFM